ncbi:Zinc finger protein, partial [Plecturocebus cupreus]
MPGPTCEGFKGFLVNVDLKKMGFHHDGQAGLEPLTSDDPPTSAFQSARITGVSHRTRPTIPTYYKILEVIGIFVCILEYVEYSLLCKKHCNCYFFEMDFHSHQGWSAVGLTLLPVLKCSSAGVQCCNLRSLRLPPPGFKQFFISSSQVAGTTGGHYQSGLIFLFLVETGYHHISHAALKLLTSEIGSHYVAQARLELQAQAMHYLGFAKGWDSK